MGITEYLVLPKGAKRKKKRVGRGQGSGMGKTSCRGNKGQGARGRTKRSRGFEGGQMPLIRRIPKRGFTNIFRTEYQIVNIQSLDSLAGQDITPKLLYEKEMISHENIPVKILGAGKLTAKVSVTAHAFSNSAKAAIEKAGGKIICIGEPKKQYATRRKPVKPKPAEPKKQEAQPATEKKPQAPKQEKKPEALKEKSEAPKPKQNEKKPE